MVEDGNHQGHDRSGGATPRNRDLDAQALARHSTPEMTLNVYGRPQENRLSEAVEQIAAAVLSTPKRAIYVQRKAVGAERENATSVLSEGCALENLVAGAGFEPTTFGL